MLDLDMTISHNVGRIVW